METCHFKESDWQGCNPPCQSSDLSPELIDKLEYARVLCGIPLIVTSAYRSVEYEHSKGRSGSSSHCKGLAVDISCYDSVRRRIIIQNLLRAGFKRLGVASTFIHADIDSSKPSCVWLY